MNTASKLIRRFTVPPVFAAGLTRKSRIFELFLLIYDNIKSVPPYLENQAWRNAFIIFVRNMRFYRVCGCSAYLKDADPHAPSQALSVG